RGPPAARRSSRHPAGDPVGSGRLGHRLLGPSGQPARRRPLPPPGRGSHRSRPARRWPGRWARGGALPAAAARPVAELPASQVPRAAVGPNAGDYAAGGADRGGSRHAGRPPPGGLRPRHRRLRGAVRRNRLACRGPSLGRARGLAGRGARPRAPPPAPGPGPAPPPGGGGRAPRPGPPPWAPGPPPRGPPAGRGRPGPPHGSPARAPPLPATAPRAFFRTATAPPGQAIPLPVGDATVPVRLAAAIRAFPSAGAAAPAVIVDLGSLEGVL